MTYLGYHCDTLRGASAKIVNPFPAMRYLGSPVCEAVWLAFGWLAGSSRINGIRNCAELWQKNPSQNF